MINFFLLFLSCTLCAEYTYEVAATAVFRNEGRFLREWIEYHRLVGVEHFYLTNNLSTDNYKEVLAPYIQQGIVELFEYPFESQDVHEWNRLQCHSYKTIISKAKGNAKWLAILDMDEFVVPKSCDSLPELLSEYESYGGLAINWQLFGTNDVYEVSAGQLLTEQLTRKAPTDWPENRFIKSVVRPERVKDCTDPHIMVYKSEYFSVNTAHNLVLSSVSVVVADKVQINHYWTKDEKFFYEEKMARRSKWDEGYEGVIGRANVCNQEEDFHIQRFIPALRKRMGLP